MRFSASAEGLRSKAFCCFGANAPQLALLRERSPGEFVKVYTTSALFGTLTPRWNPAVVALSQLSNGEKARTFRIEVASVPEPGAAPDVYGSTETSVEALEDGYQK